MTFTGRPSRLQLHGLEASLLIRYDIIYDLFIAAVRAHTFVIEERDILFIFNLSTYLEVVLDVWMLFHIPLSRAQSSLAEEVDGDVTYYNSEEAGEEEEFMGRLILALGILAS
jgi:hypothetical protein